MDLATDYQIIRRPRPSPLLPFLGYAVGSMEQIGRFPTVIVDCTTIPELLNIPTLTRLPGPGDARLLSRVEPVTIKGHAIRFYVEIGPPHMIGFAFQLCPCHGQIFDGFMTWGRLNGSVVVTPARPADLEAMKGDDASAGGLILPVDLGRLAARIMELSLRQN